MQFLLSNGTNILNLNCSRGNFLPNLFLDPFFLQLLRLLIFKYYELANEGKQGSTEGEFFQSGVFGLRKEEYTMVASQRSQHTYVR